MAIVSENSKKQLTIKLFNDEYANIITNDSQEKITIKSENGKLIVKSENNEA